jgi:hypothetical protein
MSSVIGEKIEAAVMSAYSEANATGQPVVLIIPTTPILAPVSPVSVAQAFATKDKERVENAVKNLLDVYSSPSGRGKH